MASTQEMLVPEVYRCYHCGLESTGDSFKYFDNKKEDQPRFKCDHCRKFFTLGSHGRPQGRTYAKKRNEDPPELKNLSRQCSHCGVADHALFKYYNNNSLSQPRFKCLSCRKQFQMRLLGTGEERRLVNTSSSQRTRAPRRQKQSVPEPFSNASSSSEPFPNASSSSSEDGSYYQPCDGSFMPMAYDPLMPLESGSMLLPEMCTEDADYADFLEAQLAAEENTQADPGLSCTPNGDNGSLLSSLSEEALAYLHDLEIDLLTDDALSPTSNVDGELPPEWSNEDAQLVDSIEASVMAPDVDMVLDFMNEMVSESTPSNQVFMYGTTVVDGYAASDNFDSSWSHGDTSVDPSGSMSYADAAAACCHQMDMDMAQRTSMLAGAPVQSISSECSSSSAGSTMVFADSFHVIPEPILVQQALTEDEQSSHFHWNEDDESDDDDMETGSSAY